MYKNCKVIMLSINEKALIYKFGDCLDLYNDKIIWHGDAKPIFQHLYITSDEEIKEGDWCLHLTQKRIKIANTSFHNEFGWKKIIATTDTSLTIKKDEFNSNWLLPRLPQQFINYYIEEYNKGNVIKKVKVEYIDNGNYDGDETYNFGFAKANWKPKFNPDNTINIKPIKDSWTKEEVISFGRYILQISNNIIKKRTELKPLDKESGEKLLLDLFDKWIKQNI